MTQPMPIMISHPCSAQNARMSQPPLVEEEYTG